MNSEPLAPQDLNHPYAYSYVIGVAPPTLETQDDDAQRGASRSLTSAIISGIAHMLLLVIGALVVASIQKPDAIELEVTTGPVESSVPIETFVMSAEPDAPKSDVPTVVEVQSLSEFEITDPSLSSSVDSQFAAKTVKPSQGGEESQGKSGKGSEFFGAAAYGDEFVYVVDRSGSMGAYSTMAYGDHDSSSDLGNLTKMRRRSGGRDTRFDVARRELLRSIKQLDSKQSFCVIMFSSDTSYMFDERPALIKATNINKSRVASWVNNLDLGGGTQPEQGLKVAFRLQPDAVFLLSDGEFQDSSAEKVVRMHRQDKVPVHTIAFESMGSRRNLRRLSNMTNGQHRYVGTATEQDLLAYDLRTGRDRDVADAMKKILEGNIQLSSKQKADFGLRCCGHLVSSELSIAKLAHDCMVRLADEEVDFGPNNRGKPRVVLESRRRWTKFWQDQIR